MRLPITWPVALALLSACHVEASCGDRHLQMDNVEGLVRDWFARDEMVVESVDCPSEVEVEVGGHFECTVKLEGVEDFQPAIRITMTDDEGNVDMERIDMVAISALLEEQIRGRVAEQTGRSVEVDCGVQVRKPVPGRSFECDVTDGDTSHRARVTFEDDQGNVDWTIVE